ncbi:MAG: flagellar filament capping protein FliD [Spirochaetes bacterium]|nr:flagellar filament capping protein FliD [Spirochaetota bacterium]MBU0955613.1 flagellar filament capping protein FliD [Spirochaetota bacterium]
MSDISIPGVSSKYNTQKLIEDLMKIERIPVDRAQERLTELQEQKSAWQDLNRRLLAVRESARNLFSFQNPFNARVANSSDNSILTALASREAVEETVEFTVKQTASADRFMSARLPENYQVPAGRYIFKVGEEQLQMDYRGGSLKDFSDNLNRRNSTIVRSQLVPVTSSERILVIEALKTGSDNRLIFEQAAETLALDAGLVAKSNESDQNLDLARTGTFAKPSDTGKVLHADGILQVKAGAETALRLGAPTETRNLILEVEIWVREQASPPGESAPSGPGIPTTGSISYEDITIQSAPSEAIMPEWTPPPEPPRVDDNQILFAINDSGQAVALPETRPSGDYQTVTVPLSLFDEQFAGLGIRNNNTHRDVSIKSVRVFDPDASSGFTPVNAVSTSRDAVLEMSGIEVIRPSNAIDDLIPGVTINLKKASTTPVELQIEPDRETVKEAIISMVGNYNRTMAELNVLSRREESVIDELEYLTEDEVKTFEERLGMFQGDSTLTQMRSTMSRIMMDAYPTRDGASILAGFGISTNSQAGGGYDATRLRGYLEIDEKKLEDALTNNFELVRDVFGRDTDNDLIIDSGAAVAMDNLVRPYVETGGIVSLKTRTIDTMVSREQTTIASLEVQLTRKEDDLKRKYGMMESALNQMESTSSAWTNFTNQNQD